MTNTNKSLLQELKDLIIFIDDISVFDMKFDINGYFLRIWDNIYSFDQLTQEMEKSSIYGQKIDIFIPNKWGIDIGKHKITFKNRAAGVGFTTKLHITPSFDDFQVPEKYSGEFSNQKSPTFCRYCGTKILDEKLNICEFCGSPIN